MNKDDIKQLAKTIGQAIARHREACGLTQEQVAERLGIGNEAVSRMERGVVMPTVARLAQLAEVFGCPTAELLSEVVVTSRDRIGALNDIIEDLSEADRLLILTIVDKLTIRLLS